MVAVLIDLHVRPVWTEAGDPDIELLLVQARDHGLDGVAIAATDAVLEMPGAAEVIAATGVQLFHAVELPTDNGPLLCYPRVLDAWYQSAGWRSLPRTSEDGIYAAEEVVQAFVQRGGAIIAIPGDQAAPAGASALVLIGHGSEARGDDDRQSPSGRFAGVGASGTSPGQAGFGAAATVFACPPSGQESLVEGLRSGRMWPAAIGPVPQIERPAASERQPAAEAPARPVEGRSGRQGADRDAGPTQGREPVQGREMAAARDAGQGAQGAYAQAREPAPVREAPQPRGAKVVKKPSRYDVVEKPGDNRGNRLNREEVLRTLLWVPQSEEDQPALDPVAMMYGLDTKKQMRWRDKSDADLDRNLNGNRNKGPDPNIMAHPQFEDMRQERLQLSLLFAQTEERNDLEDSIALRFALSQLRRNEEGLPVLSSGPRGGRGGPRHSGGNGGQNGGGYGNNRGGAGGGGRRRR